MDDDDEPIFDDDAISHFDFIIELLDTDLADVSSVESISVDAEEVDEVLEEDDTTDFSQGLLSLEVAQTPLSPCTSFPWPMQTILPRCGRCGRTCSWGIRQASSLRRQRT